MSNLHNETFNYRRTIGAVIHDGEGRYLILRRNPVRYYGWGLVKGGIEVGEDYHAALAREIAEEIGTTITSEAITSLNHRSAYFDNGSNRIIIVDWFLVNLSKNVPITLELEEWIEFRWATFDEGIYQLAWQTQQRALRIAYELLETITNADQ